MFHFVTGNLSHFLAAYGYWAVLLFVAVESTGIPFPGETMLLTAAIYAGTAHTLQIPLVIAAAAAGAIAGDNLGFFVGREGGFRLLHRHGHLIRLDDVIWASLYGLAAYALGSNVRRLEGPVGVVTVAAAILAMILFFIMLRRNQMRLEEEAERAIPGPLDTSSVEGSRGGGRDAA